MVPSLHWTLSRMSMSLLCWEARSSSFDKLYDDSVSPFLHFSIKVPLTGTTPIRCISCSYQFCIICRSSISACHSLLHISWGKEWEWGSSILPQSSIPVTVIAKSFPSCLLELGMLWRKDGAAEDSSLRKAKTDVNKTARPQFF